MMSGVQIVLIMFLTSSEGRHKLLAVPLPRVATIKGRAIAERKPGSLICQRRSRASDDHGQSADVFQWAL
jgi:hypothetical protein